VDRRTDRKTDDTQAFANAHKKFRIEIKATVNFSCDEAAGFVWFSFAWLCYSWNRTVMQQGSDTGTDPREGSSGCHDQARRGNIS
jgi:hypothetical protein